MGLCSAVDNPLLGLPGPTGYNSPNIGPLSEVGFGPLCFELVAQDMVIPSSCRCVSFFT